ncbi:alpha/beta fold hydrolase [Bdellovibrio sp. HCB274]|uniref:alpha/beta fold hydrolase n=1 Tax=Bdellovibrio sp. HCB274 TaxID=3394361 RepID=UPI0039B56A1A
MNTFIANDGTKLFYKDQGTGPAFVFSHGWPLNSDAWEVQMMYLASKGYRVISHDRRGHGRSEQTWDGNNMDTYADDLSQLLEHLDAKNVILVGHSTGGGEITRYIGRYGTSRVAGAVLIGAVAPGMMKSLLNPHGLTMDVFDGIRAGVMNDRSQYFKDFSTAFFGTNRPGNKVSQGMKDTFWMLGMQGSLKAQYDCIAAFSESDFTKDLKRFDMPTLVIHGDDDQIVPFAATAARVPHYVPQAQVKIYKGGDHALPATHKQMINEDLLAFAQQIEARRSENLTATCSI